MQYIRKTLAVLLCMALLSACAAPENPVDTGSPAGTENVGVETKPVAENVVLTISVFMPQQLVNTIAAMFMDSHPGVTVKINSFFDDRKTIVNAETGTVESVVASDDFSEENYARYLNTLLMSGNADDIILFQEVLEYGYESMGALADLTPYIESDPSINDENFFMNVLNAAKTEDGRQYFLPILADIGQNVYFSKALTENTGITWADDRKFVTSTEVFEYAKRVYEASTLEDTYFYEYGDSQGLASQTLELFKNRYSEFVDLASRSVHFDNPAFVELIQSAYDTFRAMELVPPDEGYNLDNHLPFSQYPTVTMRVAGASINNPDQFYRLMPMAGENGQIGWSAMRPAITANSKNKDLAWEFIRFMLGDDVQTLPNLYSLGVSRTAFPIYVETYCAGLKEVSEGSLDYPPERMKEVLADWLLLINGFPKTNDIIDDMVWRELILFYDDEQTAEETAKNIQHKCGLYLSQ